MINFKLIKNEYIEDVASDCYLYKHKNGAKIIYLKNDDINKVFVIGFKTEANDNCGTAHIVEHCTLCGSQKYKLKDPFNILDKGTIHTYLNAITYQDKTIYPVAGTNENDFHTMVDVYLDAVFNPLMTENEGIFQQEGWHNDGNSINGVVYNEMKGVFSLPLRVLKHKLQEQLYKNSPYEYYSGGIPQYIPQLNYCEFVNYYFDKYHPSNSIIYLYGDMDINKYLKLIDDYISKYSYRKISTNSYSLNNNFKNISINVDNNSKNYLMGIFNTGTALNYTENLANQILVDALFNNESSLLRQQLLELGAVVKGEFDNSKYYSDFTLCIEDTISDVDKLMEILLSFQDKEIPNSLIHAEINKLKFYIFEKDFGYKPKGLYYGIDLFNGFLYDNEDFTPIKYNALFNEIKNINYTNLYKKLISKGVYGEINNKTNVSLQKTMCKPVSINPLLDYQNQKDTVNELNKIKIINPKNISKKIISLNSVVDKNIIYTPINSDISYIDFSFDISVIDAKLINYLGIYMYVIDKFRPDLSERIKLYLGGLKFSFSTFTKDNAYIPVLILRAKFLNEYIIEAMECIEEFLFNIKFNSDKLNSLIREQKQLMSKSLIANGNAFAINYGLSCCDERFKLIEMITGIEYINFITNINECVETKLNNIKNTLFTKANCTISYSCLLNNKDKIFNKISLFYNKLPNIKSDNILKPKLNKEACFYINSMVNYNALTGKISMYNGYFKVIKQIITSYLWDNIRIKGGAYGGNCDFYRSGYFKISSYRDPRVKETFDDFYNIPDWLSQLNISENEINRHIIGAINILDAPIKDNIKSMKALSNYYGNLTDEILMLERQQVLETNLSHIKKYSKEISIENSIKCSVGNEKIIEKSKLYNKFIKFS